MSDAACLIAAEKIRVLICDDSLVIRGAIARLLRAEHDFEIVATVCDGAAAIETVRARRQAQSIDVVVLDIEMPVLNGMAALPVLLSIDPTLRVIMASTLTTRGASITVQALGLGAADYVPKPSTAGSFGDDDFRAELVAKVRGLGCLRQREQGRSSAPATRRPAAIARARRSTVSRPALLAIGSSTGGPQALFTFFRMLGPKLGIPVVLTQHMPASFVPLLAEQITKVGGMTCCVATDGEVLRADRALIAPGGRHLTIHTTAAGPAAGLSDAPPENYCRPSVDVMLRGAASAYGGNTLVVMMTGMGRDGLLGTQAVVDLGGVALAQDESSSVVWGMPGAITNAGLCRSVLPLTELAGAVRDLVGS